MARADGKACPSPPPHPAELEEAYAGGDGAYGDLEAYGEQAPNAAGEALEEALGEVTNRLAAAYLMAVAPCDTSPAGRTGGGMGGGAPRTTLKALAPMTAAKALMRADTPSSLASPEALSPSMRWVGGCCSVGKRAVVGLCMLACWFLREAQLPANCCGLCE